ncbi:MAG: hypothetical protein M3537_08695 [Chloroflexota bacterium]|nr:hypothetical protein [Chloroflexota bacterium]
MTARRSKSHLVGQSSAVDPRRLSAANFAVLSLNTDGPHTAPRLLVQRVIVTGHAFGVAAQRSRAQGAQQRRRQRHHAAAVRPGAGDGSVAAHPPGTAPGAGPS